jgi:hypothetical protein
MWYAAITTYFVNTQGLRDNCIREHSHLDIPVQHLVSRGSWDELVNGFCGLLQTQPAVKDKIRTELKRWYDGNHPTASIVHCKIKDLPGAVKPWLYLVKSPGWYIPLEAVSNAASYDISGGLMELTLPNDGTKIKIRFSLTQKGLRYPRSVYVTKGLSQSVEEQRADGSQVITPRGPMMKLKKEQSGRPTSSSFSEQNHQVDMPEEGKTQETKTEEDKTQEEKMEEGQYFVINVDAGHETSGRREDTDRSTPKYTGEELGTYHESEQTKWSSIGDMYIRTVSLLVDENDDVYEGGLAYPGRSCWIPSAEPRHAFLSDADGNRW